MKMMGSLYHSTWRGNICVKLINVNIMLIMTATLLSSLWVVPPHHLLGISDRLPSHPIKQTAASSMLGFMYVQCTDGCYVGMTGCLRFNQQCKQRQTGSSARLVECLCHNTPHLD